MLIICRYLVILTNHEQGKVTKTSLVLQRKLDLVLSITFNYISTHFLSVLLGHECQFAHILIVVSVLDLGH